jgi:hypothetical protein
MKKGLRADGGDSAMHPGAEPRPVAKQRRICADPVDNQPMNSTPGVRP